MAAEAGVQEQFALPAAKLPVVHKVLLLASLKVTVPVAPEVTAAVKVTAAGTEGQVLQASAAGVPSFGMLDGGTF